MGLGLGLGLLLGFCFCFRFISKRARAQRTNVSIWGPTGGLLAACVAPNEASAHEARDHQSSRLSSGLVALPRAKQTELNWMTTKLSLLTSSTSFTGLASLASPRRLRSQPNQNTSRTRTRIEPKPSSNSKPNCGNCQRDHRARKSAQQSIEPVSRVDSS